MQKIDRASLLGHKIVPMATKIQPKRPPGKYRASRLLREFKKKKKLSWDQMSEKLGFSKSLIHKWVREDVCPTVWAAGLVARRTGGYVPMRAWNQPDRSQEVQAQAAG